MDPQLQPFPKLGPRFLTEEENRKRMSELLNPNYYEERTKNLYDDEATIWAQKQEEEEKLLEQAMRDESERVAAEQQEIPNQIKAAIERMYKKLAQELPDETELLKEWFRSVGDNIEGKFYEIDSLNTYSPLMPPEILSGPYDPSMRTLAGIGVIDFYKLKLAVYQYGEKWKILPEILMKRLDVHGTGQVRLPEFKMLAEIVNKDIKQSSTRTKSSTITSTTT